MLAICRTVKRKYSLSSIAMIHRLGTVAIGKESVLIAVSSPHRKAAWKAGEEALEECKRQVEVWKKELFGDMDGGVWRANRDETAGTQTGASENDNAPEVGSHGPVIRATRPGERGHGPVVHPSGP
jgi:molybdopterin synthase catalytic subunit